MNDGLLFVVPGPLDARTGGSIYDRRMVDSLRRLGRSVDVLELDASFPYPTPGALEHASRALASVPTGAIAVIDSLAFGAMPDLIVREASRLRIVALIHLPLSAHVGLDPETAARFESSERTALHAASFVVVTGAAALPLLARYELPADRVVVIEPGTDRAPLAQTYAQTYVVSGFSRTAELLCVGTLNAGKGHELLLEALASVPQRDWHLTCAGSLVRDRATVQRVRAAIAAPGLEKHVSLVGDLDADALAICYDRTDVFVLATHRETYGMAVAEALAHGLPVVATTTGAIPQLVGDEAGVLVPVGDRAALTDALTRVLADASLRARLAAGARRVRDRLPTWDEAAARMAAALDSVDAHG